MDIVNIQSMWCKTAWDKPDLTTLDGMERGETILDEIGVMK